MLRNTGWKYTLLTAQEAQAGPVAPAASGGPLPSGQLTWRTSNEGKGENVDGNGTYTVSNERRTAHKDKKPDHIYTIKTQEQLQVCTPRERRARARGRPGAMRRAAEVAACTP